MNKNIFAYTADGYEPAYISVNTKPSGEHAITVRDAGPQSATAEIAMTEESLLELADSIYKRFGGLNK